MEPEVYQKHRQILGTQMVVADLLGIDRVTLARRESGALPINKEAELALLHIQQPMSTAKTLFHASENGEPFRGSYGIFLDRSDNGPNSAVIVACGIMLSHHDAGRDAILNQIIDTELRGIRSDRMRFIVVTEPCTDSPIGSEFVIFADLKDFKKRGGKTSLTMPDFQEEIVPRRSAQSYDIRGGLCRFTTSIDACRRLGSYETVEVLLKAGITISETARRRFLEGGWDDKPPQQ